MDWQDIAGAVGKAAPLLGTLLGGPAGGAVGGIVAAALGANSPDGVAEAIKADPEIAVKLRQIEADNMAQLQALAVQAESARLTAATEELRIAAADRDSARKLSERSSIPGILAVAITLGFFSILGVMLAGVWKPADNQALLILLGALGTSWGAVVNYYFGSSAGSARKDELMNARKAA